MNDIVASPAPPHVPAPLLRKLTWRLIPFLCLLYVLNLLDRSNIGFARIRMQDNLHMSEAEFNWCIGIFYFGYLLFEVPSNLLLRRVGARRWIARIMVTWGLVSCMTAAVTGPWSLGGIRVLLGVAEAGFFPGIVFYLTFWFPARERARVMAWFMTANAFAGMLGNPLSGAIMQYLDGAADLHGWQWLFILEGIPSVAVGCVVLWRLRDGPADAAWLTSDERTCLTEALAHEDPARRERHGADFARALVDARVWLLICLYFTVAVGANAYSAYLPTLTGKLFEGRGPFAIGLLTALPHLSAILAMTLLGAHSDRAGERRKHVAFAAFLAAAGWTLSALAGRASVRFFVPIVPGWAWTGEIDEAWVGLAGFCIAQAGMMSMLPIFWAIPTSFLSGAAAAGGIALINSVANLGGLLGPTILGEFGLWAMAGVLAVGGLLALCVRSEVDLRNR
jgi:ACS family tartrate transporter-like MFS transporter